MKRIPACLILLCFPCFLLAAKSPVEDPRTQELATLKRQLLIFRDSLQRAIALRWQSRQHALKVREIDKEDVATLIEEQERQFNAFLAIKEERYSLQRRIDRAEKQLEAKKQQRGIIVSAIGEIFEKEAETLSGLFPLDSDSSRMALTDIRRLYGKKNNIITAIKQIRAYWEKTVSYGIEVSIAKKLLLPDGSTPRMMTVARFGTVCAYGKSEDNQLYVLGQSGQGGVNRYRIRPIGNMQLSEEIMQQFTLWMDRGIPAGTVTMDIMQSDISGELMSGRKITVTDRITMLFKTGGPVMFPLALLPLWALLLVFIKMCQFLGKQSRIRKTFAALADSFDKNGIDGMAQVLRKMNNCAARTVAACTDTAIGARSVAESAAKEILFKENTRFGRHLNTLAVIAGVAPLLGLLGTVSGMIRLFEVITRFGTGDPKLLAGGISEALLTTEVGLIIAVPVLLLHNFLRNYKNGIVAELQTGTMRILNRVYPQG